MFRRVRQSARPKNITEQRKVAVVNSSNATAPSISIRRATLQGYLVFLLGLLLVIDNTLAALSTGTSLADISGTAVGLFAIGGGVLSHIRPERIPRGAESPPTYLYVLAGIASVAFVFATFLRVS